ncbi:MAG TPA: NusG domain II-containing protein [Mobilitalea sp.]|nr:NusG domain II-containing protein [Mobilitalea sp.]
MIRKNDIILIAAILLISAGIFAYIFLSKKEGSELVITVDGKVYDTLDLNKDTTYTVKGKDGSYNTFQIKNGYADMIDASCPDLLCVKQKDIHYNHETIVCLPNKVVLEVINGDKNEVDMIAN